MNYVGIDWAYGRAAFCAMGEGGEINDRFFGDRAQALDAAGLAE